LITNDESLIAAGAFAEAMAGLGPFEPAPRVAVAVSGGADSMALSLLVAVWARAMGGSVLALIVDHGLRAESATEAGEAASRLQACGIAPRVLRLTGLVHGPGLASRARAMRFAALTSACAEAGIVHLLLGHHAADQAETVLIRVLGGTGPTGSAAMPALAEGAQIRLLRPLLRIPPLDLRAYLLRAGVAWTEDPSNDDVRALRPRLRMLRADREGAGAATSALVAASAASGAARADQDALVAMLLSERVSFRPEGFAVIDGRPLSPAALSALIQAVSGAAFPPSPRQVAALAASPRPATLAGTRLVPSRDGLLLVREAAAMGPPVAALPGAVWDGRFRLPLKSSPPAGAVLGPLGGEAAKLRRRSPLPASVLYTLPALRCGQSLIAVPHLLYPDEEVCGRVPLIVCPPRAASGAPFHIAQGRGCQTGEGTLC
jgi:tRNA(Ile)-lysidine synthase